MKIAASSYSFSQAFRDGRYNQMTCIAKAKEMGFDAVEFVGLTPHDGSSPWSTQRASAKNASGSPCPSQTTLSGLIS
ncbi:MAG: hypothetical protein ACLTXL_03180 [Clostridia bacterium]